MEVLYLKSERKWGSDFQNTLIYLKVCEMDIRCHVQQVEDFIAVVQAGLNGNLHHTIFTPTQLFTIYNKMCDRAGAMRFELGIHHIFELLVFIVVHIPMVHEKASLDLYRFIHSPQYKNYTDNGSFALR